MTALTLILIPLSAADPQTMDWTIDGVKREALVFAPAKPTEHPPLVFGFHGHGGNMRLASRKFDIQTLWPEAVVVYMQGLPTVGRTDPDGKQPGWQNRAGILEDRDLKFFDAVLATMKEKYKIDEKRVYATGHSNGGGFTYLLAGARPGRFAAVAPVAAGAAGGVPTGFGPVPLFHAAGEKDPFVPFENQKRMIEAMKKVNGCEEQGTEWAKNCTLYKSSKGAPVVAFLYPGGHDVPAEAPGLIAKFFKEHERGR